MLIDPCLDQVATSMEMDLDWLAPSEALTRFRPPETGSDVVEPILPESTVIGFRIGTLGFLVAAGTHCQLLEQSRVNPLPNVQPWISGLLNLHGNLVPVFNLRALSGEQAIVLHEKRYLFTVGREEKTVALWIDGLPEILSDLPEPLPNVPALAPMLWRYVTGGYLKSGRLWLNLPFEKLFKSLGSQHANLM